MINKKMINCKHEFCSPVLPKSDKLTEGYKWCLSVCHKCRNVVFEMYDNCKSETIVIDDLVKLELNN